MQAKETETTPTIVVRCRDKVLDCTPGLSSGALVMGILNVTPDSFSDGGKYLSPDAALLRAEEMVEQGVDIIDVGGESSRPTGKTYGEGARPITPHEEMRRVAPVIKGIVTRFPSVLVSVDTYKPDVAKAAMEAGAHMINDITGLRYSSDIARVAADAGAALILMHSVGTPGALPHDTEHKDVIDTVTRSLTESLARAKEAGATEIILDPGFGFGKSVVDNLRLIRNLDQLSSLHRPLLLGISRKSTIATVLGGQDNPPPPEERLFGTLGATVVAVMRGASIIRTHDIRQTVETLKVVAAITHAGE
jgi:dihydropteroate synthase